MAQSNASAYAFVADVKAKKQMSCESCHVRFIYDRKMRRLVVGGEEFQLATCNLLTNVPDEVRTLAAAQFSNQMCADPSRACSACNAVFRV